MLKYQFQFSRAAQGTFATLERSLQKRILKKAEVWQAASNPLSFAKKLTGRENTFRFRVGDFRLIVVPKSTDVLVILVIVKIGHRKEVYL